MIISNHHIPCGVKKPAVPSYRIHSLLYHSRSGLPCPAPWSRLSRRQSFPCFLLICLDVPGRILTDEDVVHARNPTCSHMKKQDGWRNRMPAGLPPVLASFCLAEVFSGWTLPASLTDSAPAVPERRLPAVRVKTHGFVRDGIDNEWKVLRNETNLPLDPTFSQKRYIFQRNRISLL